MNEEAAEILALKALEWLVGNDELFPVFQGASGASVESLRTGVQDGDLLISILDFICMDDRWVLAAAEDLNIEPMAFVQIREALPGGGRPHWT